MTPPTKDRKRRWTDRSVGEHLRAAGFQANEGNGRITIVLGDGHYVEVWGWETNNTLQYAGEEVGSREVPGGVDDLYEHHADAKALVEHLVSIRDRRTT